MPACPFQLVFYGAYHDHPVNVAIHMTFVPVLLWCVMVWYMIQGSRS